MFDLIKFGAGAIVGAAVAYGFGYVAGDSSGYDRRVAEVAIADGKATTERRGDDAALRKMSDYDLCLVGLRGSGMPVDACEQLRGEGQE